MEYLVEYKDVGSFGLSWGFGVSREWSRRNDLLPTLHGQHPSLPLPSKAQLSLCCCKVVSLSREAVGMDGYMAEQMM